MAILWLIQTPWLKRFNNPWPDAFFWGEPVDQVVSCDPKNGYIPARLDPIVEIPVAKLDGCEILHQLLDGLSMFIPLFFAGIYSVSSWPLPNGAGFCPSVCPITQLGVKMVKWLGWFGGPQTCRCRWRALCGSGRRSLTATAAHWGRHGRHGVRRGYCARLGKLGISMDFRSRNHGMVWGLMRCKTRRYWVKLVIFDGFYWENGVCVWYDSI